MYASVCVCMQAQEKGEVVLLTLNALVCHERDPTVSAIFIGSDRLRWDPQSTVQHRTAPFSTERSRERESTSSVIRFQPSALVLT